VAQKSKPLSRNIIKS